MVAGISTGILNTAFSGGSGDDYLNAIAQGGAYGGLTGFATSAVLAGIDAGWEALGNIETESTASPLDEPIKLGRSTTWWGQAYYFVSNIGNGASNASIIGTTGGALTSEGLSSADASLGSQALQFLTQTSANGTTGTGSSDVYKYAMQHFPNEMNELIKNNCNPTFNVDYAGKYVSGLLMGQGRGGIPLTPKAMTFDINPNALSSDKMEYLTIGHELQHALHISRGWTGYWAQTYGVENVANISEVKAWEWTMEVINSPLYDFDPSFTIAYMAVFMGYVVSIIGIYP
jgi:hypothetical protein